MEVSDDSSSEADSLASSVPFADGAVAAVTRCVLYMFGAFAAERCCSQLQAQLALAA